MAKNILKTGLFIVLIFIVNACSVESSDGQKTDYEIVTAYTYSDIELQTMKLINDYRVSNGLGLLEVINHVSFKAEEHNNYMIEKNLASHDDFVNRSENIIKTLGAKKVDENVGYNYQSAEGVLNAWLNSPEHRKIIEGDFNYFGISIRESPEGKKFYTNIFLKI
jgi:uncharacterized protein YkwD